MSIFNINNININYLELEIYSKTYAITKTIVTKIQKELIRRIKFAVTAFKQKKKIYIVYIASIVSFDSLMNTFQQTLIRTLISTDIIINV